MASTAVAYDSRQQSGENGRGDCCPAFGAELARLRNSDLLGSRADVEPLARSLRQIAERNLSVARLYEGHANARGLIEAYGSDSMRSEALDAMTRGQLFGVWGADGVPPVTAKGCRLSGLKRYASGLGHVDHAIVAAASDEGQQLFLIDARDRARHNAAAWDMAGMQDSASGVFDCDGLEGQRLGPANVYTREPLFVGGTWRIAAVSLGGIVGLLDGAARALRARGQIEAEAHLLRLSPLAGRTIAAWPFILRAGRMASGPEGAADPERAAAMSAAARLLTEELGQEVISAVERSVGLSLFAADDPLGRHARDLGCYLRQAARDAFSLRVGRALLASGAPLGEWLDA
ncbi:acyl-CoA dehydrogenase [Rhodobacter sp. NSM]|uniref:acyl-CoA dehydrogenase n=1 Tax=Rhodobacter sp. NSM TaxID=3457501 RepID=UPI003FD42AB3